MLIRYLIQLLDLDECERLLPNENPTLLWKNFVAIHLAIETFAKGFCKFLKYYICAMYFDSNK